jgi:multiple antibiotic resistance protein
MGFFAIMNPIANVPIFIGLVEGQNKEQRKGTARLAAVTAFLIVTAFVLLGKMIFDLFGITIPAFKITGGILLFYVGFEMLMSKKSKVHHSDNMEENNGVAVSPLAIPILAGPGTIVTAMNSVTKTDFLHIGVVVSIFAIMILLTYWAFLSSNFIIKKLGQNLISVIGKLMGLILAIMGTDMIIHGIKLAF